MKTPIEQAREAGHAAAEAGIAWPSRDKALMHLIHQNPHPGTYASHPFLAAWFEGRNFKRGAVTPSMRADALMGCIVTVPKHISAPATHCEQFRRDGEARVGRVIEAHANLVSVQFFGYPTAWDYSLREAAQFEVNSTMSHVSQGWLPAAEVMRCRALED